MGKGVRVRSEAKAAAADRLLLAAQEEAGAYDFCKADHDATPKWRFRRRRKLERLCLVHAARYMKAIRGAQEIAAKGKYVDV